VVSEIANILAAVLGFAAIIYLVWIAYRGDGARDREDAARAFYDEHGHWPGDSPDNPAPDLLPEHDPRRAGG
jgi:hypothetical protein